MVSKRFYLTLQFGLELVLTLRVHGLPVALFLSERLFVLLLPLVFRFECLLLRVQICSLFFQRHLLNLNVLHLSVILEKRLDLDFKLLLCLLSLSELVLETIDFTAKLGFLLLVLAFFVLSLHEFTFELFLRGSHLRLQLALLFLALTLHLIFFFLKSGDLNLGIFELGRDLLLFDLLGREVVLQILASFLLFLNLLLQLFHLRQSRLQLPFPLLKLTLAFLKGRLKLAL